MKITIALTSVALTTLLTCTCAHATDVGPDETDPASAADSDARRGRISFGYQTQHTRGLITNLDSTVGPGTTTDTRMLNLSVDYRLTPRWEVHLSLPYIRKNTDSRPRQPNGLPGGAHTFAEIPPNAVAEFIDDGAYHGNWQDWTAGLSYHAQWRGFDLEPRIALIVPSTNYPYYGNAATGQRLTKLKLGIEASRRIGLSDWW